MSGLSVKRLVAGYGGDPVLREVDFEVPEGGLLAVLGPSGCGKTTLLRVLAGFHPVSSGEVWLGGRQLTSAVPPEQRGIGIVPQEGALFPHLTVAGNVGFGLRRGDRGSRVEELLDLVGLAGFGARMPAELSGGQAQRVALARALAPRPGVVLLDEPFSALDAGLREELRADVRATLKAAGATALLVTHDQEEALGIADHVVVLRDGAVAQFARPQTIYTSPTDLGVALFVGEAVTFPGVARSGLVATPLGELRTSGDGPGTVLVRPEQLILGSGGVMSTVDDVRFHGHDATVLLRLADGTQVRSRVQGRVEVRAGDSVSVSVDGPALFFGDTP
ncbi:ABC transporter ATP-binding protein [Lentzea rhizosphaerae]|uniref:ABC transporter ATP-binding protein n=1 Tax=Lentzea rhizosphaerae TaxID=2041025 RepID=A0ABV8BLY5_9PSEU